MQNYDSHLIFQELGTSNFKINVIPKTIEKYMSFSIELNKIFTSDCRNPFSLHILNASLENLVRNLQKNDYHHIGQEFNAYA